MSKQHKTRFRRPNKGKKCFNSEFKRKPNQGARHYQHQDQLHEVDVGITEYISKLEGFSGVIKVRFSDFQVNEIDPNNEVAKLTSLEIPPEFEAQEPATCEDVPVNPPLAQIPQDKWDELKGLAETGEPTEVELDATDTTKEQRIEIHECMRTYFGDKVVGNTSTTDGKKLMRFRKFDGKKGDKRLKWPSNTPEYVHFLVYKECSDTLDASLRIARCLHIQASNLSYAGLKDRRAKTTQWFSVRKMNPRLIIQRTKPLRNIKIGNFTFKTEPMKLGQLRGNKFRIAVRNVGGSDELIEQAVTGLSQNGFINYYGLQRFGHDKEIPTYSIGVQLLLGNWKEACEIILRPTKSDQSDLDITKAKKVYLESKDAALALKEFEANKSCNEYLLLSGLSKGHANDYVNALTSIPRNTRLLYIHSFQSLMWNLAASKRIAKYGLEVVAGDLILLDEESNEPAEENDTECPKRKVKALAAEECSNYTIHDIVLPLPGYDIVYPDNLKYFYKEELEKHGLTLEMPKQKVQTYTLSGTYRKLMGKVQEMSWKIMHYTDPNDNLIRSDLEELTGIPEPVDMKDGTYKALVLEFNLNSASYATMVLRELLKTDTSTSAHAKLNSYHENIKDRKIESEKDFTINDSKSLLRDSSKYEAFKDLVFGNDEEEVTLKRKLEDSADNDNVKVAKTAE